MYQFIFLCLFVGLLSACGSNPSKPQSTNYTTEGNLEVTKSGKCVDLKSIDNTWTPADMTASEADCIRKGDYANAFDLSMAASVYGRYDALRVADQSAHQAVQVLLMNAMSSADEQHQEGMREYAEQRMAEVQDSRMMPICDEMKALGRPDYHPRYMIQHGMGAFSGQQGNGLVRGFNANKAWQTVLNDYMNCS